MAARDEAMVLPLAAGRQRGFSEDAFAASPVPRPRKKSLADGMVVSPKLRTAEQDRVSTFTEYFFDILYVMPLQNLFGVACPSLDFFVFFAAIYNSWIGEAFYNTRFDTDDIVSRLSQILGMVCVAGMSFGCATDTVRGGGATFMLSYACMRLLLVLKYFRAWLSITTARWLTGWFCVGFGVAVLLWIAAAVTTGPLRVSLCLLALLLDYGTPFALLPYMLHVNRTHMPDRFASITTLISAGNLFALVNGPVPPIIDFGAGGRALLFPGPALLVWLLAIAVPILHGLLYTQCIGLSIPGFSRSIQVRVRAYLYMYLHMPLALALQGASAAIATIDCPEDRCHMSGTKVRQLVMSFGGVLLSIGVLHALGDHGDDPVRSENWLWRTVVRVTCSLLPLSLGTFLSDSAAEGFGIFGAFGTVALLGIGQVLVDLSPCMQVVPSAKEEEGLTPRGEAAPCDAPLV